ncbi:MAG: LpqN/LpqT family lipoprotein [Mycolicibacterium sp.]|nr:LpqN/LpqT family lipoprotein [Mycolicibacterium sp.]
MTSMSRGVAALAVLLLLAGCGSSGDSEPSSDASSQPAEATSQVDEADAAACETVDAPMIDIPARADGEPAMAIPAPPGWERTTELDSDLVRAALVNQSLTADGFAPNVVVTLESIDGDVSAQDVFEQQRTALTSQGGATDLKTTTRTLCGQPAETTDYMGAPVAATPARPITVLLSTLQSGGRTYSVAVTVQTLKPDDPTYVRDRETILSGFSWQP